MRSYADDERCGFSMTRHQDPFVLGVIDVRAQ